MDVQEIQELVTLEIEGCLIQCNKATLINNSDYFKVMFEGNFIESSKQKVSLKDVSLHAMNLLLKLLWDKEYALDLEDLLSVLDVACMLQFIEIKDICGERLLNNLSVSNCLKIWLHTEHLAFKDVYCKAKLTAFLEFLSIKESSQFMDLPLADLCKYLGSIYLQTTNEFVVYESFKNWCIRNNDSSIETIIALLHCLNINELTDANILSMMNDHIISGNTRALSIFESILNANSNTNVKSQDNSDSTIDMTITSLLKSKPRNKQGFPCILVENISGDRLITNNKDDTNEVFYYDKYKRKRKYEVLDTPSVGNLSVIGFDARTNSFKKLFDVEPQKLLNLDGFKTVGHKQYIFMMGGEEFLGKGNWNTTFFQYDTIKEIWLEKPKFPFNRRHFESLVCREFLYVIGGTGAFRVIQENIFWYSLVDEKWCDKEVALPCSGRQIKCCCFKEALFVLNINNKVGYLFKHEKNQWITFQIEDKEKQLPSFSQDLCLFSYKNSLFIKAQKLLQLNLNNDKFTITSVVNLVNEDVDAAESIICNNILYSLSRRKNDDRTSNQVSLVSFNIETHETSTIISNANETFVENNENFKLRPSLDIFNLFHHYLLDDNDNVNMCDVVI